MKLFYQSLTMLIIIVLMTLLPAESYSQETKEEANFWSEKAPCSNYWSVGIFGGVMQFNGDLSKNHIINLAPNSIGYNFGLTATKQFSRVIGVRGRFAYGMVQSSVDNKFTWDWMDGNGTPGYISQKFRSNILESDIQGTINWTNWILGSKPERFFSSYLIGGVGIDQSWGTKWDLPTGEEIAYLGNGDQEMNVGNTGGIAGSDIRLKLSAGLGFDLNINKHFSIPVEFLWRWQNSDYTDMTKGGAQNNFSDMYSSGTVGITYKFGYRCPEPPVAEYLKPLPIANPAIKFYVIAPANLPAESNFTEIFPIRNYVFFDAGSDKIPARYVLLSKAQVKNFREDQLDFFPPSNLSGRSDRQMIVYYNILNILGDRMSNEPSTKVHLAGSSMEGENDGKAMAESVKSYLVKTFEIDPSRISTEGRIKPRIVNEQPGGTKELDLLREGDRRVSITSTSSSLLMEFQSGEGAPLKPVKIKAIQKAPADSYVSFNVIGATKALTSWTLEIKDAKGKIQNFGPYTADQIKIPGADILGAAPRGSYHIMMTGKGINGDVIRRDTTVNMVLWTSPEGKESSRFSVIYEFNESTASALYEKYLTEIVLPKIPANSKVVIQGHTDIIGDETYNQDLSLARANNIKSIMEKGLKNARRTDVTFEVFGFGENPSLAPFENDLPEKRFYNRSVTIDIMPQM